METRVGAEVSQQGTSTIITEDHIEETEAGAEGATYSGLDFMNPYNHTNNSLKCKRIM